MQLKQQVNKYVSIIFWLIISIILSKCGIHNKVNHQNTLKVELTYIDSIKTLSPTVTAQVVSVRDKHFIYTGGEGTILECGEVNSKGFLKAGSRHKITDKFGGIRGVINIKIKDEDFLIVGNKAENAIEVHQINERGALKKVSAISDTDSTFLKGNITTKLVKFGRKQFVFVGGLDAGLSCLQLSESGELSHIQSIADDSTMFLNGIIGMTTLVIDGKTFLFAGGFIDGGISSFRVYEDGSFENMDNVKDDEQLFLTGTFSLNAVQLGNNNYLLVGHRHKIHYPFYEKEKDLLYHGDGINVFSVNAQGKLTLNSLLKLNVPVSENQLMEIDSYFEKRDTKPS